MITYNRETYTRIALSKLLETCDESMRVWIWHNGQHQPTLNVVKKLSSHPRFYKLKVSLENKRLREPTNWFWNSSDAEFLSKVDDDCMEPEGWGKKLRNILLSNSELGIVGTWRFYDEDFIPELANKKMYHLNQGKKIMQNCWVQGSGYVMRRKCLNELGPLKDDESFPAYCIRASLNGWINGWYFPFLFEDHMDDPRSKYCTIKSEAEFAGQRPLSAINDNVYSLVEWTNRVRYMARIVQEASVNPKVYVGWRSKIRSLDRYIKKILRRKEPWRLKT